MLFLESPKLVHPLSKVIVCRFATPFVLDMAWIEILLASSLHAVLHYPIIFLLSKSSNDINNNNLFSWFAKH